MATDKNKITKAAGEVIFREGEHADYAYIIDEGEVEISVARDGRAVSLGVLGSPEIIGEMAVIDDYCRTATATVRQDCVLTVVTPRQIQERMHRADPVVKSLLNILLTRYRSELALESGVPMENETALISAYQGIAKIRMENDLRESLGKEEVKILYQPIRSLNRLSRSGFEALVRWDHVSQGAVLPSGLVTLAEETDLIDTLTLYVFRAAAEDLVDFRTAAAEGRFVSVNISPRQTVDSDFLNKAWDICNDVGCEPSDIMLELTESIRVDIEQLKDWVDIAKAMGFLVSVDDFGTGFTSLEYLTRLEPHTVKIDKNFIRPIVDDSRHVTVVKKVIELARELDALVIAEGAETYDHLRVLTELGCDMAQGYEIDRPLTKFQTIDLLAG